MSIINRNKPLVLWLMLSVMLLAGCSSASQGSSQIKQNPAQTISPDGSGPIPENNQDEVNKLLSDMTLEEKIGQMFFICYRHDQNGNLAHQVDDQLKNNISHYHVGGLVLFSENISTIDQTQTFISDAQDASNIPLFIAVDEEGGIVTRLNKAPDLHSTKMPNNYTIGLTDKPEYAYEAAKVIAEEIGSLGFNMDFAPVADIFTNPENKVIGKRAYGTDTDKVSMMVGKAVAGFRDQNIIPVLKHFPGHGDTHADSHTGAAEVNHDMDRLKTTELAPFREGIKAGADMIMTAHILLPKATKELIPASLSKELITDVLRNEMGFNGVVITDALEMSAISTFYSEEEAVVQAVAAGVDMLLIPTSLEKSYTALLKAVHDGIISEERINESVRRILALKNQYHLLSGDVERPDPESVLGLKAHQDLANKIREEADSK